MTQLAQEYNPFLLMISPEVVLAAIEKSERLGQLNRHMCRPLDRPVPGTAPTEADATESAEVAEPADGEDAAGS